MESYDPWNESGRRYTGAFSIDRRGASHIGKVRVAKRKKALETAKVDGAFTLLP